MTAPASRGRRAWGAGGGATAAGEGPAVPPKVLLGRQSPLWSRDFGLPVGVELGPSARGDLEAALAALGAERMVVGHTPQVSKWWWAARSR